MCRSRIRVDLRSENYRLIEDQDRSKTCGLPLVLKCIGFG